MKENKLIAEFMNMKYSDKRSFNNGEWTHSIESLNKFKTSWKWLMPVVEKIEEQHGCDFEASRRRTTRTYDANFMDEVNNYVVYVEGCKDRKEATYRAVVSFIKENTDTEKMMKMRIADMDNDLN